jgi:hypothetical protein
MARQTGWDIATYPNPTPPPTSAQPTNENSSLKSLGVFLNTGEISEVGEWVLQSPTRSGGLFYYEQINRNQHCTGKTPMMTALNKTTKHAIIFRPRCKLWNCAYCGQKNAALWTMRIVAATQLFIDQGKDVSFVTVTSHEKLSPTQTISALPDQWAKLSTRFRRATGGCNYAIIPETHTDGRLHLHGIFDKELGTRWWKDNARNCGMGFMAEEKPVYSAAGAGAYTSKYTTKQLQTNNWAKGFRRVRTSRFYPLLDNGKASEGWEFSPLPRGQSVRDTIMANQQSGYSVALADNKAAWALVEAVNSLNSRF